MLQGNVVTLVTIPKFLPVLMQPQIGDYKNPYILKLEPCEVRNGKYYNLRTDREVKKAPEVLVWTNLSGTVFRYGNPHNYAEENLLVSRRFENGKLLLLSIDSDEITPTMISRKIFEKRETNVY